MLFLTPNQQCQSTEGYGYYRTLIGNHKLEDEPTGHCGWMATRSGWNGSETIAGTASEAFAGWLHHQYAPVKLPWTGANIVVDLKRNASDDKNIVGVKGLVRDASSLAPVAAATVAVSGRLHTTQTTADGEFWRLLLPGAYVINVSWPLRTLYPCIP